MIRFWHVVSFFALFLCCTNLTSQNYFQQKVDYKINAKLDTLNQTLKVECILSYKNNSPDALDYLLIHLWWNAYSDKQSSFSKQSLMIGDRSFYFSKDEEMGAYRDLDFQYNNNSLTYEYYSVNNQEHKDIAKVILEEPIAPGDIREFTINYTLKIPTAFSRAGFADNLYRMTQWYPKPAVYDIDGWHPMPYLMYGEYYSEFGDYEVEINVPVSFSVASTGLADESKTQYKIEERQRVFHINANNVHDFAWFTSEYYLPYTEYMEINDETIRVIIFAKDDNERWESMMKYAKRSVEFYSDEIAPYPYPQVTVVEETSGNGSGMEYPMITIIDSNNEEQVKDHLISHEIGHNWFYGILASNERDFTWMDEGLNSFYEHKYNDLYYLSPSYNNMLPGFLGKRDSDYSLLEGGIIVLERMGRTQPISLSSEQFDPINYVSMNYEKMAWAFEYLEGYLGESLFQTCVRTYYEEWSFKHPNPSAMQESFESASGKDLSWFFEDLIITDDHFDYSISTISKNEGGYSVKVSNKNELAIPFSLSVYSSDGTLMSNEWYKAIPSGYNEEIVVEGNEIDKIEINGENIFIDVNRRNNIIDLNRKLFKRPLKFQIMGGLENADYTQVNIAPSVMFNEYDGFMLGLHLNNGLFPVKNFRWFTNVAYGFGSGDPVGLFSIEKDILPNEGKLRKWTLGLDGRRFNYNEIGERDLDYFKLAPNVTAHFSSHLFKNSSLQYKVHYINLEKYDFVNQVNFRDPSVIHQLNFRSASKSGLAQNKLLVQLEYENYDQVTESTAEYLKLSLEYEKNVYYNASSKFFIRFFGGYFPINSERESSSFASSLVKGSIALTSQGYTDHTFEEFYFGRTGTPENGGSSSQIDIAEGGFKNTFDGRFQTGFSNDYAVALNLKVDLPLEFLKGIKVRPYLDMGYLNTKSVTSEPLEGQFLYSSGLSLEVGDFFGLYVPLVNSSEFNSNYGGSSLFSRISFKYNLRSLNVWKAMDNPGIILK